MLIDLIQAIPFSFAALFPILNPFGAAVIFMTLTSGLPEPILHKLSRQVAINAFVLLVTVLIIGSWILQFFGIGLPVLQIAGGLVVAYIAWNVLNRSPISNEASNMPTEKEAHHLAFFPLTMPMTAGPGSIAVTMTLGAADGNSVMATFGSIIGILLAAITIFICYRYANSITRRLGSSGVQIIMRLFAFINLCVGIQIIWRGITGLIPSLA